MLIFTRSTHNVVLKLKEEIFVLWLERINEMNLSVSESVIVVQKKLKKKNFDIKRFQKDYKIYQVSLRKIKE